MQTERPPTQRALVDLPLHLSDTRLWIEHAFPFVDRHWKVPFFLLDAVGMWPSVLREDLDLRAGGLFSHASSEALQPLGSVPLEELAQLVHFDPWWVLRSKFPRLSPTMTPYLGGYEGPDPAWVDAFKATNISVRFTFQGRPYGVTDLIFEPGMRRLVALEARTSLGRLRNFRYLDVDLTALRRDAPGGGPGFGAPKIGPAKGL